MSNHRRIPARSLSFIRVVDNHHEFFLTALAACNSIQVLSLSYRLEPKSPRSAVTGSFMSSLCAFVEQGPPFHPELEHFRLNVVDRDGATVSFSSALCDHLAFSLQDETRYPRFRTLTLCVRAETWARGGNYWMLSRHRGIDQDRLVLERWRRLFSSFNEERVQLNIQVGNWS